MFFPFLQGKTVTAMPTTGDFHISCIHQADGTAIYGCPVPGCNKTYGSPAGCRQHMDNTHNTQNRKHTCPFCNKVFSNRSGLRNHKIIKHNANSNLRCQFCNTPCLSKPLLFQHLSKCTNRRYAEIEQFAP